MSEKPRPESEEPQESKIDIGGEILGRDELPQDLANAVFFMQDIFFYKPGDPEFDEAKVRAKVKQAKTFEEYYSRYPEHWEKAKFFLTLI